MYRDGTFWSPNALGEALLGRRGVTIFIDKRTVCVWLTCTVAAIHLLNIPAVWLRYSEDLSDAERLFVLLFQVSSEGKIPTWYSACTLLACSVLLVLIAVGSRLKQRPHTWHWAGLAAIFGAAVAGRSNRNT